MQDFDDAGNGQGQPVAPDTLFIAGRTGFGISCRYPFRDISRLFDGGDTFFDGFPVGLNRQGSGSQLEIEVSDAFDPGQDTFDIIDFDRTIHAVYVKDRLSFRPVPGYRP